MTLLADATEFNHIQYWVLAASCAALGSWSLGEKRFDTFAVAIGYAYIATLCAFLRLAGASDLIIALWTIVFSSGAVIAVLLWARSRFKQATS